MTERKRLVLDANILLRAVFGARVRGLLETYEDSILFFAPDVCFAGARKYIPSVAAQRGIDAAPGILSRKAMRSYWFFRRTVCIICHWRWLGLG